MRFPIKIHARESGQFVLSHAANRLVLLAILFCSALQAQPAFYEAEPNNTPAVANKISGAVTIMGLSLVGIRRGSPEALDIGIKWHPR